MASKQTRLVAEVSHAASGRTLQVETNAPGLQLYTGNFLGDTPGKDCAVYGKHAGQHLFALELAATLLSLCAVCGCCMHGAPSMNYLIHHYNVAETASSLGRCNKVQSSLQLQAAFVLGDTVTCASLCWSLAQVKHRTRCCRSVPGIPDLPKRRQPGRLPITCARTEPKVPAPYALHLQQEAWDGGHDLNRAIAAVDLCVTAPVSGYTSPGCTQLYACSIGHCSLHAARSTGATLPRAPSSRRAMRFETNKTSSLRPSFGYAALLCKSSKRLRLQIKWYDARYASSPAADIYTFHRWQDIDSLLDASLDVLLQQLLLGHEVRVHDCYIAW